jgi:hypothetical protein
MSVGYIPGRRDESISVAAGVLREATTSVQGWALVDSHHGQVVPVVGSRVVLRVDLAAGARTPIAVTDGRDAFSILAEAATADARQEGSQRGKGWDAGRVVAVSDLVGTALAAKRLEVKAATVRKWRERYPDFPSPIASTGGGALYSYAELKAWRRARRERRAPL